MPYSQWYPGNLNLVKTVEDTVVFLTGKEWNFQVNPPKKPQTNKEQFKDTKHEYLIYT